MYKRSSLTTLSTVFTALWLSVSIAAAQSEDSGLSEDLPPPAFGGSQQNFFDLPVDEPLEEEGTTPIALDLPDPYFGGTPLDYKSPNLEKPNYKPRAPFMAPTGTANVAQGKPVTSSADPEFGELSFLVDDDTSYEKTSLLGLAAGLQWIQIDFGIPHDLYALALWHFHEGERVYFDVVVQVADDPEFTQNIRTVFNSDHDNSAGLGLGGDKEYVEDYKSKFLDLKSVRARCIRFYSDGNTTDDLNHYVEAKVFGKPVE